MMLIRKSMTMKSFKRMRIIMRKWKMITMMKVMMKGILNRMMVMKIRMVKKMV